jgi:hypothetical protein
VDIFLGHTKAYAPGSDFRPDGTNALPPSEHAHYLFGQQLKVEARAKADRLQTMLSDKEKQLESETNQLLSRLSEAESQRRAETNRLSALVASKEQERKRHLDRI